MLRIPRVLLLFRMSYFGLDSRYGKLGRILAQEDTDGDSQITVHDGGPKSFTLGTADSAGYKKFELRGHYAISNLLQELALASDHNRRFIVLHEDRLSENPVDRMTRLIKFHFWDGLVCSVF